MTTTSKPGGYGQEFYGDPFGAGGPLHVVRAIAVASHVVRVVFDEAPIWKSPSGVQDGRNPSNYVIRAVVGVVTDPATGRPTSPLAVGTGPDLLAPPGVGLLDAEERAVDVHADRPLVQEVKYEIEVRNVLSALGGELGAPISAQFFGIAPRAEAHVYQAVRSLGFLDIAEDPATGAWVIDDSGDLATHDGIASLRKRIFRRATTLLNAFTFLSGYGAGVSPKEIASVGEVQTLRNNLIAQCKEEPDVAAVSVSFALSGLGVLIVTIRVQPNFGQAFEFVVQRDSDGSVTLLQAA